MTSNIQVFFYQINISDCHQGYISVFIKCSLALLGHAYEELTYNIYKCHK